jgi:hypothetical protein
MMGKTGTRLEREMAALIRKTRRKVQQARGEHSLEQDATDNEMTPRRKRYVDRSGASDIMLQDASAEEIFREMKRRDF